MSVPESQGMNESIFSRHSPKRPLRNNATHLYRSHDTPSSMFKSPKATETTHYATGSGSKDLEAVLHRIVGSELSPKPQAQIDRLERDRYADKIMFLSNEDV